MAIIVNILGVLLLAILVWRAVVSRTAGDTGDDGEPVRNDRGAKE